jgi:hypothetical protein
MQAFYGFLRDFFDDSIFGCTLAQDVVALGYLW